MHSFQTLCCFNYTVDDSSEVNVSTRRKKRNMQIFFDSESQGNDSYDACEFTTASSINENSGNHTSIS